MASQLAEDILGILEHEHEVNTFDLAEKFQQDHQKIIGAVKSLQSIGDLVSVEPVATKKWEITAEGQHVIDHGSHEAAVYNATPESGIPQSEIMKNVPYAKIGFSKALVAGWIELDKSSGQPIIRKKVPSIVDTTQNQLKNLSTTPENVKADYKKRKLLQEVVVKSMILRKGPNFSTKIEKQEADLTSDLLINGAWKEKKFKPYNFDARGSPLEIGHLHPLLKVRSEFRKIFLEMGFTEMPTNNYVESSFWNFDALFQPQQHPARDAHDTFFVSEPRISQNFPQDYLEKVKEVHSVGGYGSQGYRYDWKIEEAQKNLLRTHTTAVSARMLYKLMQKGEFKPVRYFSIDRVFRNETLDATHLAEFHQVEGVVADYSLTLGDLIGTLYEFFKKLGITELEFKPAYNPYTEPSMEIFCFHKGLGKWIEIGNSGVFRPEMLLPMGLPENVNVIAWGLSLERPTMIKYGLNNIRDLVGPKVDLQMVHNNPICRLEKVGPRTMPAKTKECRDARRRMTVNKKSKDDIIIFCDPEYPMYSLEMLLKFTRNSYVASVMIYTHSSIIRLPSELENFCRGFQPNGGPVHCSVTFIWKKIGIDPILKLPEARDIFGEVNILRYINRLMEERNIDTLIYESKGITYANQIDSLLEKVHSVLHGVRKEKLDNMRGKSKFVLGDDVCLVDILLESFKRGNPK